MKMPFRTAALAVILGLAGPLPAHDFWIEVSDYSPDPGAPVKVCLKSGHAPLGESVPRLEKVLPHFVLVSARGSTPIPGIAGKNPAGYFRADNTGPAIAAYSTQPRSITLDANKFDTHLVHEGLDAIREEREKSGTTNAPAREAYTKYAKCLLRPKGLDGPLPVVGHPLEIVPDTDPTALGFDGELTGRVLFQGSAAPGLLVSAFSPTSSLQTRTDQEGRFYLRLPQPGMWMTKAVRMAASKDAIHDWESQWASLVFRY